MYPTKQPGAGTRYGEKCGNFLILGTAVLWSFLGIFIQAAGVHGLVSSGITSLVGAAVLVLCNRRHRFCLNRQTFLAGLITAGMNLTFFLANSYTTVTNAIVLQYCSPIFVLILNIVVCHYRPGRLQVLSLGGCMAGMAVFFLDQLSTGNLAGNLLALASGLLFAGSFFLNAKGEVDPISSSLLAFLLDAPVGLFYMAASGGFPSLQSLGLLVLGGIFLRGLAGVLYSRGMRLTTALSANMIALSEVFLAPLWARLLFHEALGRYSALGIVLMVSGIVLECYSEYHTKNLENSQKKKGMD